MNKVSFQPFLFRRKDGSDLAKTPLANSPHTLLTSIDGRALTGMSQDEIYDILSVLDFNSAIGHKLSFSPVAWPAHKSTVKSKAATNAASKTFDRSKPNFTKGIVDHKLKWKSAGGHQRPKEQGGYLNIYANQCSLS